MQRERVEDQYPWTWEIPLAVVCAIIALAVAVCQLGRSFVNWFADAGGDGPPRAISSRVSPACWPVTPLPGCPASTPWPARGSCGHGSA